jgi:hypothetical protein
METAAVRANALAASASCARPTVRRHGAACVAAALPPPPAARRGVTVAAAHLSSPAPARAPAASGAASHAAGAGVGAAAFGRMPRRRGHAALPPRAGFSYKNSVADGTLSWDTGGGTWVPRVPGSGGGGGGGGGGSGGSGSDGSSAADGWPVVRGFAWAAALFFMAAKSLVCWCSVDPKAAATNIDLGFLLGMALLACASLAPTPLAAMRPLLVQLTLGHIVAEMAFYGVILNKIDPSAAYKMSGEMWLHHVAVAVGGVHTVALMALPGYGAFAWVGTQLIVTEITTFLPVAFHQALKNKRMTGGRSVVLGVLFPSAFALRVVMSAKVLRNYMAVANAFGLANVPFWWVSAACSVTILALNTLWTGKIVWGGARQVAKRRARSAAAGAAGSGRVPPVYSEQQTVYSEASEAAVYSELTQQKKRLEKTPAAAHAHALTPAAAQKNKKRGS